jgi:secreted PhoX family phosphatase
MTCRWRCADACAHPVPNRTDNAYFGDIVSTSLSRRGILKAGGVLAALGGTSLQSQRAHAASAEVQSAGGRRSRLGFQPVQPQPAGTDHLDVPSGFEWAPIIAWGDPILPGAPDFDFDRQSPEAQAGQFGYNNDFTTLLRHGADGALLVCNNEYTNDELMFRGYTGPSKETDEQIRIAQAAQGMSVVELRRSRSGAPWRYVRRSRLNRRVTAQTPMRFVGPAAGSELLRTSADPSGHRPVGTFGNCAGGATPWGTVLSGEENFNGYFRDAGTPPAVQAEAYRRYGVTGGKGRGWERVDPRFDTTNEPNEPNRFGWIVELDPSDPTSAPRKLTALGRMKHEGATTALADDGRVVVYMGDDERFDYTYKFVSRKRFRHGSGAAAQRHNRTLLEDGDLYVARFVGDGDDEGLHDGRGEWLPLVLDGRSQVPGMTLEHVLIWTRLAADRVDATKMDRPEDVETNPVDGKVYLACTNNSNRTAAQVDEANPRAANKHGHIVEISPRRGDHASRFFTWDLLLVAGDPEDPSTYFAGYDKSRVSPISCPDNVTFDRDGNLWIATDGNALGACDGLYVMPLAGPERGHLQQFLSVPAFAETCGPVVSFDERVVIVAVQHPGEDTGASPAAPKSQFPYLGDGQPRPAVVQVWRRNGRPVTAG